MRSSLWFGLAFALGALTLGPACAADAPAPYTLFIESVDVDLSAIDEVEIILEPSEGGRRFKSIDDTRYEDDTVRVRVTARGQYVMVLSRAWLDIHAVPSEVAFELELLLQSGGGGLTSAEPQVTVTFLKDADRIAVSTPRFLPWPLTEAGSLTVSVRCSATDVARCAAN